MTKAFLEFYAGFRAGMEKFGMNLAVLVNSVLLLLAYIFGVGLTSYAAKISGKKFLELKPQKDRKSYWEPLDYSEGEMKDFYRQF